MSVEAETASDLPVPLRPWSGALNLFPEPLNLEVGGWVQRLALAMGPLRTQTQTGRDEPEGYHGIARKGPYERLLLSDWVLADEFPDEFNRRAVMNEHSFFELGFRAPAGSRRCIALLDAGPTQIGNPRIAHLAALIVLSRRARDANAEFLWGVLQDPAGRWLTGVTASTVQHWLKARSASEPTEDDALDWLESLGKRHDADDLWVIGGPRTAQLLPRASRVEVEDGYRPDERVLQATVQAAPARRSVVTLPLPSPTSCVQLLRNPLKWAATEAQRVPRVASRLVFLPQVRRLLYVTQAGAVQSVRIPTSPREPAQLHRLPLEPGEHLLSAGWDKGLWLVTGRDGKLWLNRFTKNGAAATRDGPYEPLTEAHRLRIDQSSIGGYAVVEAAGSAKYMPQRLAVVGDVVVELMDTRVYGRRLSRLATSLVRTGDLWFVNAELDSQQWQLHRFGAPGGRFIQESDETPRLLLSARGSKAASAVSVEAGKWRVDLHGDVSGSRTVLVPSGAQVLGATSYTPGWGLVSVAPSRRAFHCHSTVDNSTTRLAETTADVVQASLADDGSFLAWLTATGELAMYSMKSRRVVSTLFTEGR